MGEIVTVQIEDGSVPGLPAKAFSSPIPGRKIRTLQSSMAKLSQKWPLCDVGSDLSALNGGVVTALGNESVVV
jgi:hypothetical protein